jgi:hypothetical protein
MDAMARKQEGCGNLGAKKQKTLTRPNSFYFAIANRFFQGFIAHFPLSN